MNRKTDLFWTGLLAAVFLAFWLPVLNLQASLSAGDMGRDLYAFWMTFQGKWPCQDYWWQYGPLMPLYYAFWFLVGGVNLASVRMGVAVIYFLTALSAYAALRLYVPRGIAFLAALAFLSLDMTWTYNHIGALPFLILSIFFLWKFFLTQRISWVYAGLGALGIVTAVKVNTGMAFFPAFWLSLFLGKIFPRHWKHLIFLPLLFFAAAVLIYAPLYWGLSREWIQQCLTLKSEYHMGPSPWTNFKHLIQAYLFWSPERQFGLAAFLGLAVLAWRGRSRGSSPSFRVIGSLVLFGLFASVEYLLQEGLIYRFDFWTFPVLVLFLGIGLEGTGRLFSRRTNLVLGALLFFLLIGFPAWGLKEALTWRRPERYLTPPHGKIYLGSPVSYPAVLNEASRFLRENTRPDQEILTLPYDPIYCFLSGRRHALRELDFMEHIHLGVEQEKGILQELDRKKVPYVVISNRYRSKEAGVGHFGVTHARRLSEYLSTYYSEVKTFGPWEPDDHLHAVKILKRND